MSDKCDHKEDGDYAIEYVGGGSGRCRLCGDSGFPMEDPRDIDWKEAFYTLALRYDVPSDEMEDVIEGVRDE